MQRMWYDVQCTTYSVRRTVYVVRRTRDKIRQYKKVVLYSYILDTSVHCSMRCRCRMARWRTMVFLIIIGYE